MKKPLIVIFIVLLIDQISKFWVKLSMTIGESIPVFGDWFQIYFIENNGMAFGWEFGAEFGKIALGVFRIIAVALFFYLLYYLSKKKIKFGPLFGISLITAGALGNIIDGMFYGMIFGESTFTQVATLFPDGGGYAGFMQGKVVDMLYFPLFTFPEWMPLVGGQIFFSPIFNIADSAITIGFLYLLIFQWDFLKNIDNIDILTNIEKTEDNNS
ncbi:MAG: lipoprotein signal peptidase [Lentimicrobiaceae bacterium]|nr:lipoprotein signal peptidase [Lentimicrobiaceae bacterium]